MKQLKFAILVLAVFTSAATLAQTEAESQVLPIRNGVPPMRFDQPMDSLQINTKASLSELQNAEYFTLSTVYDRMVDNTVPMVFTPRPFLLWSGASVTIGGSDNQMLGLMDEATGTVSFHQNLGRLHLTGSAIANKYWMPMQSQLYTQYGLGGMLGYDLTNAVSLHAFGYYYAQNPLVAPAFNPYVSMTSFGGYANIRLSEDFGAEVGVRRYVNPMSGRWTTSPIVTPYFRVGKRNKIGIGLPLGELLKSAIWGNDDNPMRYRPQPQQPQPRKK